MILHLAQAQEVTPMFSVFIVAPVALAIGFVIGLLVGRKNPGIANAVATVANQAKSKATATNAQAQIDAVVNAVKGVVNPPKA
jgi:hypothetical protein